MVGYNNWSSKERMDNDDFCCEIQSARVTRALIEDEEGFIHIFTSCPTNFF